VRPPRRGVRGCIPRPAVRSSKTAALAVGTVSRAPRAAPPWCGSRQRARTRLRALLVAITGQLLGSYPSAFTARLLIEKTGACPSAVYESTPRGMPVASRSPRPVARGPALSRACARRGPILFDFSTTLHRDAESVAPFGQGAGPIAWRIHTNWRRSRLEALAVVELLLRADEPERPGLDQVQERDTLVAVFLGDETTSPDGSTRPSSASRSGHRARCAGEVEPPPGPVSSRTLADVRILIS